MRHISIVFCCIILLFIGCKKTKLEGEKSVLIGKWKWKYTLVTLNSCDPTVLVPYIQYSPSINGYEYEITFIEKGKIKIEQSGKRDKKYRLIEEPAYVENPGDTSFYFYLNRKNKKAFVVDYYKKSGKEFLRSAHLPLGLINGPEGCLSLLSTFEKVE